MKEVRGELVSVHAGANDDYSKPSKPRVEVTLEGFPGDKHRGFERLAQDWDPEPDGTPRRNERQWSGVSQEELEAIRVKLDLAEPLLPSTLGANICLAGVPEFSQLPKGTRLVFPSGAVLLVEEENPPCKWMADQIEIVHTTNSGEPVAGKFFPKRAMGRRGVVGVVDVPGLICEGDEVIVRVYEPPSR